MTRQSDAGDVQSGVASNQVTRTILSHAAFPSQASQLDDQTSSTTSSTDTRAVNPNTPGQNTAPDGVETTPQRPNETQRTPNDGPTGTAPEGRGSWPLESGGMSQLDCTPPVFKAREVTDQDRTDAKTKLEKSMSDLIPEADRSILKNLQSALVDGDLAKLQETLKGLAGDPARLGLFINAVNEQVQKHGINLSSDASGNVMVYEAKGSTALSINPATGATTLRAIERQPDGSTLVRPGEIINRQPADTMRSISDRVTRSLTGQYASNVYPIDYSDYKRFGSSWRQP